MTRAALYVRVSTDEQSSSLNAQESGGRAWCDAHGATVVEVYSDEGVSGAEWVHRAGLQRMLADVTAEPRPWDVLVVRDLDRLGRDALRLGLAVETLHDHGARCVAWSTGEELQADPMARAVLVLRGVLAEQERAQIAHRTRTALRQRAEKGFVAGGCVYGYRTERTAEGARYVVHEPEAEVVREAYRRHVEGESARSIAQAFNRRGLPAPRSGGGGTGSWCGGTVRAILRSPRYRGEATWGEIGSRYRGGSRVTERRADVVHYQVPAIVDEATWTRAQTWSDAAREANGRPRRRGLEPRYLLIGHAICDACGGPIASWRSNSGSGPIANRRIVQTYRCLWHADRGAAVCAERYCRPMEPVDRAVLGALAGELTPDRVSAALARAREILRASDRPDRRAELEAAERAAAARVTRLGAALELGGDLAEVVTRLRAAQGELERARAELRAVSAPPIDLGAERELVALASDVGGALVEGYDRASQGDLIAMRHLRGMLTAALPRPLRIKATEGGLLVEGSLSPVGLLVTGGIGATPMGFDQTPCLENAWEKAISLRVG